MLSSTLGQPPAQPDVSAQDLPARLDQHELLKHGQAANRAKVIYPGVVGEFLHDELVAARDFKLRLHAGSRVHRLVQHLMTTPVPPAP